MNDLRVLASLMSLVALGGCAKDAPDPEQGVDQARVESAEVAEYKDISVAELQTMLATEDFPLVNVHVPFEGDLPDTDASIPFDQIESHLGELPADKGSKIVLYCKTGRMSVMAATTLAKLGYTNVYNLVGGFNAWSAAGLPLGGG